MFQQRPLPPMNSRGFFPTPTRQLPPMGGQPFGGSFMGGQQQFIAPQTAGRGAGGLKGILSRFLPGTQGVQGIAGAAQATGGLQSLASPANLSSMLGNVQKVLGMAQQVTPMVQQYGPLVKNLPAMIKIYSELKNSNSDDSPTEPSVSNEDSPTIANLEKEKEVHSSTQPLSTSKNRQNSDKKIPKSSSPKMYV
ncbi:VrrA/YqfQ family protein [Metabacillus herbersteinensis]|uniref:VrrA/YqfQ family protein n=1 Tax=Metabacillus herbersteinensis TaxID=283816 RepID=A0ABV6G908_9BACI